MSVVRVTQIYLAIYSLGDSPELARDHLSPTLPSLIHRAYQATSHDHRNVRIYGHYPVTHGKDITYYRFPIHSFDIVARRQREMDGIQVHQERL